MRSRGALTRSVPSRRRGRSLGFWRSTRTMSSDQKLITARKKSSGPEANKYTEEELMLLKNKDMGYILQRIQSEKKKVEKLSSVLHELDSKRPNKHVYFAEDREEARKIQNEIKSRIEESSNSPVLGDIPARIKRKTASSYRELEERKQRLQKLEKLYTDMALQKELQKPGCKRKLHEDEMENPISQPVYKWRAQRKR